MRFKILLAENHPVDPWPQKEKNVMEPIKILLADDHQAMRQHLHALVAKEPNLVVVAEAADNQSAVRLVRELGPQVVIMGIGMNGINTARQILAASPGARVIALSFYSDQRIALNLLKAGVSAFLLKDCAFEELARAIHAVMAQETYLSPGVHGSAIKVYLDALRECKAQFSSFFQAGGLGVALLDREGRLLQVNPALQNLLGYRQDELQLRTLWSFNHPEDAAAGSHFFQELATAARHLHRIELRYLHRDGRLKWGCLTLSRMPCPALEPLFAIAMVEDITARKHTEERVEAYAGLVRSLAGVMDEGTEAPAPLPKENPAIRLDGARENLQQSLPQKIKD
jgi:PAS domain S-box-containing protein